MLENIPSRSTMIALIGQSLYEVWEELCSVINEKYEMERLRKLEAVYQKQYAGNTMRQKLIMMGNG